ncbi:hypothetical protein [Haloferula rosea]|nr:hypothetical protein [Haloferula rosea]
MENDNALGDVGFVTTPSLGKPAPPDHLVTLAPPRNRTRDGTGPDVVIRAVKRVDQK